MTNKSPTLLRLAGILATLTNAVKDFRLNGNVDQAAAISFYSILSLVPLLILTSLAVSFLIGGSQVRQETVIEMMGEFFPFLSRRLIVQLGEIEEKRRLLGTVGFISLIWLASLIMRTIERSLNNIFRAEGKRNYLVSISLALGMISAIWVAGLAMILIRIIYSMAKSDPYLKDWLVAYVPPYGHYLLGYAIPYLVITVIVTLCYTVIPKNKVSLGAATIGGVTFTLLMSLAKTAFTWYLVHYSRYSVIYGSLDVVVIMVIWIFYLALIFLLCAEIVSSYQRRDLILLEQIMLKQKSPFQKTAERLYRKFGRIYTVDSYLFREGDTDRDLYYLLSGRVQIEKKGSETTKILASLGPGEYLGEMAALTDLPRSASARVTETAAVAVIPEVTFCKILRENERVSLSMLKELAHRLTQTNSLLDELSQSFVKALIVAYFCLQQTAPSRDLQDIISDLIKLTGKDREEISRVLELLEQEGVIMTSGTPGLNKERVWQVLAACRP